MALKKATKKATSASTKKETTAKKKAAKGTTTIKKKTSPKPATKQTKTPNKEDLVKPKIVIAEIVEDKKSNFKELNLKKTKTKVLHEEAEPSEQEEMSPLDYAAQQAETAYEQETDLDEDLDNPENIAPASSSSKSIAIKESSAITTSDPLLLYLNEIRKYPLLTKEQEIEIAKKYFETKDPEAAQQLVRSNLRFVVKVAAEYSKFGAKLIDLIQEGNVGLMHAVREYNPYKGARLITYAVWWIRGYIQEFLMRQYSMVRIGTTQNQRKLFYQLQKEKAALDTLGKEQNLSEIAKKLDIPEDEVRIMAQRLSGRDISLDKPLDDDSPASLSDFQKATTEQNIDDVLASEELVSILQSKVSELEPELSEREKIILKERLLNDEPLTLQEIGEKYGITREAVRQMEVRLLKKIKDKMGNLT